MGFDPNEPRDERGRWTSDTPVYHGSDKRFTRFSEEHIGAHDAGHLGRGFYFSTDPAIANTNTQKMELRLNVTNPLRVSLPNMRTDKREIVRDALGLPHSASPQDVTKALMARGHDAVVLDYTPIGYAHQEIMVPRASDIQYIRHLNDGTSTMKRSEFDKLPPHKKMAAAKSNVIVD